MGKLSFEVYQDEEHIGIKDGMLKIQKSSGSYKDYRSSFYKVWLEVFINYTSIPVSLFRTTVPHLQAFLIQFHGTIV